MKRSIRVLGMLAVFFLSLGQLSAAERVVIELEDGSRIEGTLLKKDAKVVHISIADKVISLDRELIKQIEGTGGEEEKVTDVSESDLYVSAIGTVKSVAAHTEQLGPAIVVVKTPSGMGTGWFCNPEGYVVTNEHVISGEQSITVTAFKLEEGRFEKKVYKKVKLVALDSHVDIALLRIEEEIGMEIPQLYIGDSTKLREGDEVFTIGNPLGLERSTAQGIVSKVNRSFDGRLYVQTTAPIAPGNSGGPLFNERGEVIGVVNMGYIFLDGLGFAVPSKYVKEVLDNVEAFAYDPDNPNVGVRYMETPVTATDGSIRFTECDFIKAGRGISRLTLSDINGDGVEEVVFVNNNKGEIGVLERRTEEDEIQEQPVDFEEINRIPDSERFKLTTHAVNNRINSMVVTDMNEDGRLDIVFRGDVDSLSFIEQLEDGTFGPPRKIANIELAKRRDALRVADFDGDGKNDLFALGPKEITIFKSCRERHTFPLNQSYRDTITEALLLDVNDDGRLDVVFFSASRLYATHVLVQDSQGNFVEEEMVRSHISGPVKPYRTGAPGFTFLTLDKGYNRARQLRLELEKQPPQAGRVNTLAKAVTLDSASGSAEDFVFGDLNGDGRPEIISANKGKNEFVVLRTEEDGFRIDRFPAPQNVAGLELFKADDGRTVLFSFSPDDKIFGVSRVDPKEVTFPRPINTEGVVQYTWLGKIDQEGPSLIWIEKVGRDYAVRRVRAADLALKAFDGNKGSIDVEAETLSFGEDLEHLKTTLPKKPDHLSFADFNGDGNADLVMHWSYSGKESLYLGRGEGRFTSIIVDKEFLEEQKDQPLLVADIDADGAEDVLLVQPGFVRVLKVDQKNKLYVERQFNWEFEAVSRLVPYPGEWGAPRFVAVTLADAQAKLVEFDQEAAEFRLVAAYDLVGLEIGKLKLADIDGNGTADLIMLGKNALQVVYGKDERRVLQSKIVFDARLEHFKYWKAHPADLDGDGKDEVLMFDSAKAMLEIRRRQDDGTLGLVCRQRLFEKTIYQRGGRGGSHELPDELAVGDVDGNGEADLIFILQDRIAIYLQESGKAIAQRQ